MSTEIVIGLAGVGGLAGIGLGLAMRFAGALAPVRRLVPTDADESDERPRTRHRTPRRTTWRPARADDDMVVADWCDDLARRIRGGESLTVALTHSTGPDDLIGEVVAATERGLGLGVALARHRGRSRALDHVLAVIITAAEVGSPAAPALDRTAAVLRDRSAARAERRTQSAQARWSATVLTALPVAAAALMATSSPSMRSALVSPFGMASATTGIALDIAGWSWMRRIVRRATL